jgi:hypothetical protein
MITGTSNKTGENREYSIAPENAKPALLEPPR